MRKSSKGSRYQAYHHEPIRQEYDLVHAKRLGPPSYKRVKPIDMKTESTPKKRPNRKYGRRSGPKVTKNIVLVGLMGCGKTTVGRRLARRLGLEFVDSDHEIERAADMSVSDIFSSFGEEEFRAGERRVIARLLTGKPKIIATGGGAFIDDETRSLIKKGSLSIWLDADIDILVERTGRRDTRPLLRGGNPEEILRRLAKERAPFYAQANLKVQSGDGPHEDVVRNIVNKLARRSNRKGRHRNKNTGEKRTQGRSEKVRGNQSGRDNSTRQTAKENV